MLSKALELTDINYELSLAIVQLGRRHLVFHIHRLEFKSPGNRIFPY